jgi:carboxypeptidase C (cathepsin A)
MCLALWPHSATAQYFPPAALPNLSMKAQPGPRIFTTHHRGKVKGQRVQYTALVEETTVTGTTGVPAATLFTTSFILDKVAPSASRPVLFVFNGGPSGSAAPLMLAGIGPQLLSDLSPAGFANTNNKLVDNANSLLDVADLVFIDPTDTGFSRTWPGVPPEQFHSIDGDSESIAVVVISWLDRQHRTGSPKYVYGESYGSVRAVALARDLFRSSPSVALDGVILGGEAITFDQGARTPDPTKASSHLAMMASLAWHYGKIDNRGQTWSQAVEKAEQFARTEYLPALALGYTLDERTRERIVERLPELIGIPVSYFRDNRTIEVKDFRTQLLKEEKLVLNGGNGLYTRSAADPQPKDTTGYEGLQAVARRYYADVLEVRNLGDYELLTPNIDAVFNAWNFRTTGAMALDATLAQAMKNNPKLRVFVPQGRYDTLTEIGETHYTMAQTDMPRDRYTIAYFDGGHMLVPTSEIVDALRAFLKH